MSFFCGSHGVSNSPWSPSPSPPRSPNSHRGQSPLTGEEGSMSPPSGPEAQPLVYGPLLSPSPSPSPSPKRRRPPPPVGRTSPRRSMTPFTEGRPPPVVPFNEVQPRRPYSDSKSQLPESSMNMERMDELDQAMEATLAPAAEGSEALTKIHGLVRSLSRSPPRSPPRSP